MQKTFFSILEFESNFRDYQVIVSLSDPTKTQSLNAYNSTIQTDNLFKLLDDLSLDKDVLIYLEDFYSNSSYLQSKLLGYCLLVYQILREKL